MPGALMPPDDRPTAQPRPDAANDNEVYPWGV
jgi:hypothetical protein